MKKRAKKTRAEAPAIKTAYRSKIKSEARDASRICVTGNTIVAKWKKDTTQSYERHFIKGEKLKIERLYSEELVITINAALVVKCRVYAW